MELRKQAQELLIQTRVTPPKSVTLWRAENQELDGQSRNALGTAAAVREGKETLSSKSYKFIRSSCEYPARHTCPFLMGSSVPPAAPIPAWKLPKGRALV